MLSDFEKALTDEYGPANVSRKRLSVCVDFEIREGEQRETHGKNTSLDVVPAFDKGEYYEIPDTATKLSSENRQIDKLKGLNLNAKL